MRFQRLNLRAEGKEATLITDRKLEAGTALIARYKGDEHTAEVVQTEAGLRYRLTDGREFSSPSSAGSAVMGHACNGWAFWSIAGAEKPKREAKAKAEKPAKKPKTEKKSVTKKAHTNGSKPESFGCGECSTTFPSMGEASEHVAQEHPAA